MRDAVLDVGLQHRAHSVDDLAACGAARRCGNGFGTGLITHCVVTTSLRSQM